MPRTERSWQQQLRSPWPWHRWLGLGAALVLVWVALTGLLLVHSDQLGLAQRPVTVDWVLDLFGVPNPEVEIGYRTPAGWIAQAGDRVFLDDAVLPQQLGELDGVATPNATAAATAAATTLVIAGSDGLMLLDMQGAVLELLAPDADPALGTLTPVPPEALPDATRTTIARAARSSALDWEQVLRVLHGSHGTSVLGKLLADLTALSLLVLSLTGIAMFRQRRRQQRKRERGPKPDDDGEE